MEKSTRTFLQLGVVNGDQKVTSLSPPKRRILTPIQPAHQLPNTLVITSATLPPQKQIFGHTRSDGNSPCIRAAGGASGLLRAASKRRQASPQCRARM